MRRVAGMEIDKLIVSKKTGRQWSDRGNREMSEPREKEGKRKRAVLRSVQVCSLWVQVLREGKRVWLNGLFQSTRFVQMCGSVNNADDEMAVV